jgi:hypothetical protein
VRLRLRYGRCGIHVPASFSLVHVASLGSESSTRAAWGPHCSIDSLLWSSVLCVIKKLVFTPRTVHLVVGSILRTYDRSQQEQESNASSTMLRNYSPSLFQKLVHEASSAIRHSCSEWQLSVDETCPPFIAAKLSGTWLAWGQLRISRPGLSEIGTLKRCGWWLLAVPSSIGLIGRPSDSLHSMLTADAPRRVARS